MSEGPVLGIDLGTTNSVVAVADGGQARVLTDPEGRRIVPSVVGFHESGRTLVGYDARDMRLTDAANTVYAVKRLIGRPFDSIEVTRARERFAFEIIESKHGGSIVQVRKGKYALAEISALVLRELRRISQLALGEACERAVITVPANFNELQRSATKAAGKVAGLDVLRILNEPTAAALAYGYGQSGGAQKVAVYDLGGGTFDITILELEDDVFEVLATAGDTFLGGEDIDGSIAEVMCEAFKLEHGWDPRTDKQAYERLKAAGEWAKCQLSSEDVVELTVEGLTKGPKGKPADLRYTLDKKGLHTIADPWLARSFSVCDEALKTAGLKATDVTSVVLVGGSTRMPYCRQLVEQYFGSVPRTDLDPDMVVAQGAAIHGYALGGPWRPKAAISKPRRTSQVGRVVLKRVTSAELGGHDAPAERVVTTGPKQPAFAPPELPQARPPVKRPTRDSRLPPPMPDLPTAADVEVDFAPPSVVAQKMVEVRTPRTTLDIALDDLEPPEDLLELEELDELAPPAAIAADDPFADIAPDALPAPGQRKVQSREATVPFAIQKHAPPRPPPPPAAATPPRPPPPVKSEPKVIVDLEMEEDAFFPVSTAPPRPPQRVEEAPLPEPPAERAQAVVAMPAAPPPILMDVTPHSLGIETAGGYCRRLIAKNAPVPTEQMRSFTTAMDDQREVAVRICQGEEEQFDKNEVLGEVVLDELPAMARGQLQIQVAFILDADGTLAVEAKDPSTGRTQRTHINLRGGLSNDEIAAMRLRLDAEELPL